MSVSIERERELVEYLLGGLAQEERERIEERAFVDDEAHEELEAAVDDLIHAYLAGTLAQADRGRFETHFLAATGRRQRLDFMSGLLAALDRVAPKTHPRGTRIPRALPRWALPAAAVLMFAAFLAFFARTSQAPTRQIAVTAEPGPSPAPSPVTSPTRAPQPALSVVRLTRDSPASTDVLIAPSIRWVRLEVAVGGDRPSYDAVLRAEDGRAVFRADGLAPARSGEPLGVTIPAEVFSGETYSLAVEGEALRGDRQPAPRRLNFRLRVRRQP